MDNVIAESPEPRRVLGGAGAGAVCEARNGIGGLKFRDQLDDSTRLDSLGSTPPRATIES